MNWNRSNLIKVSLAGDKNTVTCNACGVVDSFTQTDEIGSVLRPNKYGVLKPLKTPKAFIAWFLDTHYHGHVEAAQDGHKSIDKPDQTVEAAVAVV